MSTRTINLDDRLYDYLLDVSLREDDLARRLRDETANLGNAARMQISPEQGQFMALLVKLAGSEAGIEIGTFTGYSALSVARALPDNGKLVCCDVNDDYTAIGRRFWAEAGIEDKIDLRIAPALETLEALKGEGRQGQFDFAFIDADKENYDGYYEGCLSLLRKGGFILIDNVLWSGSVADPDKDDADTNAIRALNRKLKDDDRIDLSLLPIGDGLTLCRKR